MSPFTGLDQRHAGRPLARAIAEAYANLRADLAKGGGETDGAPCHQLAIEALRIELELAIAALPHASEASLVVLSPFVPEPPDSSDAARRN